ncbi:MAG: hypothetical protein ACK5TR_06080 [Alphaproteobacteria bacterium]|nr:hypothetical protein [Alphaproteobacteria bacterium]
MKTRSLSFFFFIILTRFVMACDGPILVCEEADFSALAQSPASPYSSFSEEREPTFERFISYYDYAEDTFADRLCWQAYGPEMSLESESPEALNFSVTFQKTEIEAPLVRFTPDLQPHDLAVPHTVVLSAAELLAHRDFLGTHLAHNPEHRIHVVLGDGPFIDGDRLIMKKDDLPNGLRHLVLSDPRHLVKVIDRGFLIGHETLTTFDPLGLDQVHVIDAGFLYSCLRLTKVNIERFVNLKMISAYFIGMCKDLLTEEREAIKSFLKSKNIAH